MKLCNDLNHTDIAYDTRECPLCEALEQIKELEKEIEELQELKK